MNNSNNINIAFVGCGRVANHYKLLMNSNVLKNDEILYSPIVKGNKMYCSKKDKKDISL